MIHGLQYAEQMSGEPTVLKIYPGADSSFMLYDDAGESYGYEKGEYSNVQLEWSDEQRILTIGKRTGQYENMPEECEFLIVTGDTSEKVTYTGEELKIVLD
jgi:alpha-D-xyloside xylohydrolase